MSYIKLKVLPPLTFYDFTLESEVIEIYSWAIRPPGHNKYIPESKGSISTHSLLLQLKRSQPNPNSSQRKWNQHSHSSSEKREDRLWAAPSLTLCEKEMSSLHYPFCGLLIPLAFSLTSWQIKPILQDFFAYYHLPLRLTARRAWLRHLSYSSH